jgi:hypothetical protein
VITACTSQRMQGSRGDEIPICPLGHKEIKSNVLKKEKVVPKYAIINRMSLQIAKGSLET